MKKIYLLSLFYFLTFGIISAQDEFSFEVDSLDYQDINSENAALITTITDWDDDLFSQINLGFEFELFDTITTSLYLTFDNLITIPLAFDEEEPTAFHLITPLGEDLIARETLPISILSYEVTGDSGSKICKVQWKDAGMYENEDDFLNMQVWLYEGTNVIEFHYGSSSITSSSYNNLVGGIVAVASNYNDYDESIRSFYSLSGEPTQPDLIFTNTISEDEGPQALNGDIPPNTVYRFTPKNSMSSSIEDLVDNVEIVLAPNPVKDLLTITADAPITKVEITNANGQLIQSSGAGISTINVSKISAGTYMVNVYTVEGLVVEQFIKL